MDTYTRDQAIAEARRLDKKGRKQAENYGFFLVTGIIAVAAGLFFLVFVAGSAASEDAATYRTWGTLLLIGGGVCVVIALTMRSAMLRDARTIYELSQRYSFDPRDVETRK